MYELIQDLPYRKNFKNLLVKNYRADLKIIWVYFYQCLGSGGGMVRFSYESLQNSSKFLSVSYLMKTADVIMNFFSSHNTTDHT